MPKNYAIYVPKCRNVLHSTCQNAEMSCNPHAKMPKNYAIFVPKCRNLLQSNSKMPKSPELYMPKCRNVLRSTCQNAEKLPNLRAKCRNVLQSTCQNAETSCALHAKMPKRTAIYMPQRRNTLIFQSWISFTIHLEQEFLPNGTHCLPTTRTTLLILLDPIVSVYLKKHKKHTNKLCGQSTGWLML